MLHFQTLQFVTIQRPGAMAVGRVGGEGSVGAGGGRAGGGGAGRTQNQGKILLVRCPEKGRFCECLCSIFLESPLWRFLVLEDLSQITTKPLRSVSSLSDFGYLWNPKP